MTRILLTILLNLSTLGRFVLQLLFSFYKHSIKKLLNKKHLSINLHFQKNVKKKTKKIWSPIRFEPATSWSKYFSSTGWGSEIVTRLRLPLISEPVRISGWQFCKTFFRQLSRYDYKICFVQNCFPSKLQGIR